MSSDVSLLDHSEPRSIKMFRPRMAQRVEVSPNVRDFWNLESREILFVESGKQFKESGIPVTIGIQNPSSTIKDWNTVPGICGVESRIQERLRFPGARRFIDKVRRKRRLKLGGLGRGHLCYREASSVLPIINLSKIVSIAFLIVVIKFITIQSLSSPLWTSSLVWN